ncbi:hypothetical protein JCM10213_003027 [Rhodosporidiobolus nylandii]
MDPQAAAQAKFAELGFFVLSGLPKGSEFGLDGKLWQVNAFSGVKFLPAGLHFFTFSAAPSAAQQAHLPESLSSGVGVRHGILRFFRQGETVVEEWDNAREELKRPGGKAQGQRKRRRTTEAGEAREETAVSDEYLKGLDKSLAPYPEDVGPQWAALTGFVTENTIARVVGVDEHGCGLVDALMGSTMDEPAADTNTSGGKQTWGKVRDEVEDDDDEPKLREIVDEDDEAEVIGPALLEFVKFDEKRSWPKGATGEELTRWSKDKSWQLSEVVRSQLSDDPKELLAELQLAFVFFSLLHNFSSLTVYKSLFSLICRSTTLARPPSQRESGIVLPSSILEAASLPLFASFLALFHSQVDFLEPDFFTTQLPSLKAHLLDSLTVLSQALSDALPSWLALSQTDEKVAGVWKEVVKRWDALAALTMAKFGWDLGVIKGSRARYTTEGRTQREEDEIDLEDLEEGEDAPVIVDEEGLYIAPDDY